MLTLTAIVKGDIDGTRPTLVRVVKGDRDGDLLASAVMTDNIVSRSLEMISEAPQGVFIYLPPGVEPREDEQRGDVWREVGLGSYILSSLGVCRIHLLDSRELTCPGIASFGLSIETRVSRAGHRRLRNVPSHPQKQRQYSVS